MKRSIPELLSVVSHLDNDLNNIKSALRKADWEGVSVEVDELVDKLEQLSIEVENNILD